MKRKPLFAVLLGLLIVGVTAGSAAAYQGLGWAKYTTTVSYLGSSARVDETIFLYGEYPRIAAGTEQTFIVSSVTGIDNEPLCQMDSGCFVSRNKRLTVSKVSGPTEVQYKLWWVGDNDGSGIPSRYASLINNAVDYMISKIASAIPYADLIIDFVKLLTRKDYSTGAVLITDSSFSRYLGNHITGGMVLEVKPTDTGMLAPGTYSYRIRAYSRTEIWFYEHSSWVFGKNIKSRTDIQPLGTLKYIKTISVSRDYTLTIVKNW